MKVGNPGTMTNSYAAAMMKRAMEARKYSSKMYDIAISNVIQICCGKRYITPLSMSVIVECMPSELSMAIERHKRALYKAGAMNALDLFGNRNFPVDYHDKIYLQGWINFLTAARNCFNEQQQIENLIRVLEMYL